MRKHFLTVLVLTAASFSDTTSQTDWSGNGGVLGPVTDWENNFSISDQIDTGSSLQLTFGILVPRVEHTVDSYFDGANSVYAADVDGDGEMDVLGAAMYADNITWWENSDTGAGIYWTKHTIDGDFNAYSVYAEDVDGDGDTDVLGAGWNEDDITWWENTDGAGTSWTEHTVDGDYNAACSVYAVDVDGDGDQDVLGAAHNADDITWWENTNGTGTVWTEHTVDGSFNGAVSVYAADVDGDGDTDVLGAGDLADDITWWENTDGTGTVWTEHTVDGTFGGASSVFAADVDGDGDTDVLGAAWAAARITWWENTDGTGTVWTEHTVDFPFGTPTSVFAADLDGDGDTDVLGASKGYNEITWSENIDGTGTSWIRHRLDGDFDGASSVYAADVDGDGDTDVLGAALYADEITWWDVTGFSPTGALESSILEADCVDFWEFFTSNEQEPNGTSVGFQFRSSDDSSNMGAWSDTVFTASTDLSTLLADSTNYFQYKVILQTTNPANSPELQDVTVSYSIYLSVEDNNGGEITSWNLAPAANPAFGNCVVLVSVPESGAVDLVLHDVTGRIVSQHSQELPSGTHSVYFNNLSEGVYFCTMRGGDFTATERIVVLK